MPTVKPWLAEGYQASGWGRAETERTKILPYPLAALQESAFCTNLVSLGVCWSMATWGSPSCKPTTRDCLAPGWM